MAVQKQLLKSSLALIFDMGMVDGKAKKATKSYPSLSSMAQDQNIIDTATAMAGLTIYPVDVETRDVNALWNE